MKIHSYKDLKLSAFCLGCAQFGQEYGIANKLILKEREIKTIINKSIESDINFFDTAADYGKSEEILGKCLTPFKNKDLVIATKIKYIKSKKLDKNIIKKAVQNSLESSLKKLRRNHLDIVYIHQYQLFSKFPGVFLEVLRGYRKKGLIRYIGISLYESKEIDKALKYNEIDVFQIPYNVLNRTFEESGKISLLKKHKKLITIRSVFLQGLFFMEPNNLPEYFGPIRETLRNFYREVKKYFNSKEQFFLGYVLSKNFGPVILGISSVSQLLRNLKIFNASFNKNEFRAVEKETLNLKSIYIDPRQWNLNKNYVRSNNPGQG